MQLLKLVNCSNADFAATLANVACDRIKCHFVFVFPYFFFSFECLILARGIYLIGCTWSFPGGICARDHRISAAAVGSYSTTLVTGVLFPFAPVDEVIFCEYMYILSSMAVTNVTSFDQ